jgi:RecB family exonuclease
MATVELLCGAARSGRARYVDDLMRAHWGRAVLLVPTRRYARARVVQIVVEGGLEGAWAKPVRAFDDFVLDLLRAKGVDALRIDDVARRFLVEAAVGNLVEQGALAASGPGVETGGFVTHVMRVIAQLKQAAIEPEEFRGCLGRKTQPTLLDQAVAAAYEAYQAALRDAGVYDLPGLFWEAHTLCRERRPTALAGIDALHLDGFDDFTPSEFRLVEALAGHVALLTLGLNYDPHPDRKDLYAVPAKTARLIQSKLSPTVRVFEESPAESFTEFASSHLFWRDRTPLPKGLRCDMEIVPCADFVQEIETIGRRVKALLVDGKASLDEIAVVYRNVRAVAETVRAVFDEFGIPVRIIAAPTLAESAVCAFLLHVLETMHSWSRGDVVEVLCAPWFCPEPAHDPALGAAFPLLSRMARILGGYQEWVARLEHLAGRIERGAGEDIERLLRRIPRARDAANALLAGVRRLHEWTGAIPDQAPPAAFALGVDDLITALGVESAVNAHPVDAVRAPESAALAVLRRLLASMALWHGNDARPESRTAFLARFREALQETCYPYPQPTDGVVCLDAAAARHLRFDYVFFGGVNEGDVPSPPLSNAIYSESDLEALEQAGVALEGKRAHSERELLLFHHVFAMPRKHLCITWHLVSRRGQEKLPSPYVADLVELFEREDLQQPMPQANAFVPAPDMAASWRDLRNTAFAYPASGLRELFAEAFSPAAAGAGIEAARYDATPFGVYDGVMAEQALLSRVAARFDENHVFSVNQIESYRACPFQFFVERLLDIEDVETPAAEFDPRERGTILHAVLQAFHEQFRDIPIPEIPDEAARAAMAALTAGAFDTGAWRSITAPRGVLEVERRRMEDLLTRYLDIERERAEVRWKPRHFEVAFGDVRGASADPLTRPEPFCLDTEAGRVRFAGRIDRIDVSDAAACLIDYKTTIVVKRKDINEGRSIQLAVYALALERFLMPGVSCAEAFFVQPGREERREGLGRSDKKPLWEIREKAAVQTVAAAVKAARAGRFSPTPDDVKRTCPHCPARRVCRYEEARIERKTRSAHA